MCRYPSTDARRLLDTARGRRLYALYSVALAVGLRRGEALALRWELVDLAGGTLRVAASLQRLDGRLVLAEPKTPRSRRTVPLPGVCAEALAAHRQAQRRERDRSAYWEDHGLVFPPIIGTPTGPRNLLRSFYALCDDAGVRRIRFHDLRHTCASLLLAQGVEPRMIMDTLGHSTIGTTLNLYAHVLPAMQRDAAARMDSLLR